MVHKIPSQARAVENNTGIFLPSQAEHDSQQNQTKSRAKHAQRHDHGIEICSHLRKSGIASIHGKDATKGNSIIRERLLRNFQPWLTR